MRWFLLLCGLTVASTASAAPFDLRAQRAAWPGASRVILERDLVISALEDGGLRVAQRTRTAVLRERDRDDLNLFTTDERPGCRIPGGIRIEVIGPDDASTVRTKEDLIALPDALGTRWSGPRPGLRPGAVIEEAFHVDYPSRCLDGLAGVDWLLGSDEAPTLKETVTVQCSTCAVATLGGVALTGTPRTLVREHVPPFRSEPHADGRTRPRLLVSTSDAPLALAERIASRLPSERTRWASVAGAWTREAQKEFKHVRDPIDRVRLLLDRARVVTRGAPARRGLRWGEPVGPDVRVLEHTEWLALATALLERHGGVPLVLRGDRHPIPEGVGLTFGWDRLGVLLPGRGVLTTQSWMPFAPGAETGVGVGGRAAALLEDDGPRLHRFPIEAASNTRSWHVTVEASGVEGLLLTVRYHLGGSWGAEQAARWSRRERRLTRKDNPAEAARSWARSYFDDRRLAATTLSAADDGLHVETAWSIPDGQRRHTDGMSIAVPTPGLSPFIRIVDDHRVQPIRLGSRDHRGSVRIRPPKGYAIAGVPAGEAVGDGPVRLRAEWAMDGADAVLTWSLAVDDASLPAERAAEVAAVGAALVRLTNHSLVLEAR